MTCPAPVLPGPLCFEQATHHSERQQHAAAAEITNQIEGRYGLCARPTDRMQRTGQTDVVDVVACRLRHRSFLAPTGHAAVNELCVTRPTVVWTTAEKFGDTGPDAF